MSRISTVFQSLAGKRAALIPFLTAGDPDPKHTVALMHRLVDAGADLIELGVPFSDPMADGPVIQQASERALQKGVSPSDVFDMVRRFRTDNDHTPVILMGYLNLIEARGYEDWVKTASQAGVDGEIIVDLPPEEAGDIKSKMDQLGMDLIFIAAPTTTNHRMEMICNNASGFIYYVSLIGVTGSANLDHQRVQTHLQDIKNHTQLPIGVGFGIRDAQSAAKIAEYADAVIVGSALVEKLFVSSESGENVGDTAYEFVHTLSQAVAETGKRSSA